MHGKARPQGPSRLILAVWCRGTLGGRGRRGFAAAHVRGRDRPLASPLARHWVDVVVALTVADLKVRYGRGGARLIKWIADPFVLAGVYLVLVTLVLERPGEAPGLSLACAVIPFQLVMATVANAMGAVVLRRSVVLNMGFDRPLIPLSGTFTETIAFAASLLLFVLMMVIYAVPPTLAILWLPVVIGVMLLLAVGVAYPASLLGVVDARHQELREQRRADPVLRGARVSCPCPRSPAKPTTSCFLTLSPGCSSRTGTRCCTAPRQTPSSCSIPPGVGLLLLAIFVPLYRAEQSQFAKIV